MGAVEEVQAPRAAFQLVHGDGAVGNLLVGSPAIGCLVFTGSREGGRAVARAAAEHLHPVQIEAGSNNPVIVCADADLDLTADQLIKGFSKLNGQWCESPGSVFVAAALHDDLVGRILERLATLRVGSSLAETTEFGPQANGRQQAAVNDAIRRLVDAGGKTWPGMEPPAAGHFVVPTLITGSDPTGTTQEIFGPVLTLHPCDDESEAVELANSRDGGLAGYLFSRDLERAMAIGAQIGGGEIKVNGTSVLDLHERSAQGFWGGSGVGGHGNAELLAFFTGTRIVGTEPPHHPI